MAETNWILNLVERVSGPMKAITSSVTNATKQFFSFDESRKMGQKELEKMLKEEQDNRRKIIAQIKEQEKAVKELHDAAVKIAPGRMRSEANRATNEQIDALQRLKQQLEDSNEALADHKEQIKEVKDEGQRWVAAAVGFNQVSEILDKISHTFDFAASIARTRDNIERMTGTTGDALDRVTSKVHQIGRAFNESDEKIAIAANAMKNAMHISYDEALRLIEQGYDKGANLNGNMLEMMQQYAPQMKEMGINAQQMVALMAQAGKQGIVSDKALDSLKKAGAALSEMGEPQKKALKEIGIEWETLADKSQFEAVQMIAKAMEGATSQAKANVIKNVFREAGTDAGMGWIEGIGSVDMNIENQPNVKEAGSGLRKLLASFESWFGQAFGNAGIYIQQFAGVAGTLNDVVGIISTLSKVTWIQNVVQKALNITTSIFNGIAKAGPWGWIAIAIGLVSAAVGYLSDKFEWAAGIVGGVKNSFMSFGKMLLDIVLLPIKTIIATLGALGDTILRLIKGDFSGAMKAAGQIFDPVRDVMKSREEAINAYKEGSDAAIIAFRQKNAEGETALQPDGVFEPSLLSFNTPEDKEKAGKDRGGMSISGAGGSKSITMNLEIKNYFNYAKGNVRELANQVAGQINDRLRDALVAQ